MHLARDIQGNKIGFYKYVQSKTKTRETICPLQNTKDNLVTHDVEKTEVFNAFFFIVVFTNRVQGAAKLGRDK